MKTCCTTDCPNEAPYGLLCGPCASIDNIMCKIKARWSLSEMGALQERFRGDQTVAAMIASAKQNEAYFLLGLLRSIEVEATNMKLHPDQMLRKVANAMTAEMAAQKSILAHDKEHGDGAWNRRCVGFLKRALETASSGVTQEQ